MSAAGIIRPVIPLIFVAAGLLAVVAGVITLRSFGPRYRVGRLLATTPTVSVAEALEIAASGHQRYVRIQGRIDAAEEFEDADHRPLVLRRTRLEAQSGRTWNTFEDSRELVPFDVREGLDSIAIDGAALGDGLVVVPRVSLGVAGDLGDRSPADLQPETPVRAVIEQVSSVEHAIVLGVPGPATDGGPPRIGAGLGRPLVLTTLEPDEAMRILAGGATRPRLAAALLVGGLGSLVVGLAWAVVGAILGAGLAVALAASPSPASGGDPRSSGEGPGLVGEPGLAILAVVVIAAVTIGVTLAYVRLTEPPDAGRERRRRK
jgi:hypothetical protein